MEGDIPVICIRSSTLPAAWEAAVLAVHDQGAEIKTEYDAPGDPPSLDATVAVKVDNPFEEPRIHKNIPAGPAELEVYRQEVVKGIHDHWVDPDSGKWTYTYHQRLEEFSSSGGDAVNQIDYMVEKLSSFFYTRRAQAITWNPHFDPDTDDPPCLQRAWARILPAGDGAYRLNFNTHWRSRDLWSAWFMNAYALTDLQRILAERISEKTGKDVRCGRYVDISDSLHIYGRSQDDKFEDEIRKMKTEHWKTRAFETSRFEPIFRETRENLEADPDYYAKGDE